MENVQMESPEQDRIRWKQICDLVSNLLDSTGCEGATMLAHECGEDIELQRRVLEVYHNYSEDNSFFGMPVVPERPAAPCCSDPPGDDIRSGKLR